MVEEYCAKTLFYLYQYLVMSLSKQCYREIIPLYKNINVMYTIYSYLI